MKIVTLVALLAFTACHTHSQTVPPEKNVAENRGNCSRFYRFDGMFYDLETCRPATLSGKVTDFKQCSVFGYQFDTVVTESVSFRGKNFTVDKESYQLIIDSETSAPPVHIRMPVPDPLPETHTYYFSLLLAEDGVVVIMEDYYGTDFTILKYNENGRELCRTVIEHTFVTHPEPKTDYHHRYLYLSYTLPKQLVFTSHMAFGEKDKTVVVELRDLSKRAFDFKTCGIVRDDMQQYVKGFVTGNKNGFTVKFPPENKEVNFIVENADGACAAILAGHRLVVANYHPIATGAALYCFDILTGRQLWKADVAQVNASHSEYYNTVYLSLYKNTIVMEGIEAYGQYLQLFDLSSGNRLACYGIPGEK